jgi:Flp pilus assembly protein TadD
MFSLNDAGPYARLLRAIALMITAISLGACATGSSHRTHEEAAESLIFDQYEGMSAAEIAEAGDEAWREGELEHALFIYMQSLTIADDPGVWMKVGKIKQHSGQTAFAWQAFTRVIELDPQSAEGHEHLGMLLLGSKRKDLATRHLEKAVELNGQRWVANNALGVLSDASGEYARAIEYYETALEHNPESAMLLTNMGYSYYLSGQLEDAERLFIMAIGIDRSYTSATRNLGLVRARSGRYYSAVKILENVMERPKALNDVGYIAFMNGDTDEAEQLLGDAVRLSPAYYETANENLERVKQAQTEARPRAEEIEAHVGGPTVDMEVPTTFDHR